MSDMKKSDLRTGMRVKLFNGYTFIVLDGMNYKTQVYGVHTSLLVGSDGFMRLAEYDENLRFKNPSYSIIEVYEPPKKELDILDPSKIGNLLCKMKEVKHMTSLEMKKRLEELLDCIIVQEGGE